MRFRDIRMMPVSVIRRNSAGMVNTTRKGAAMNLTAHTVLLAAALTLPACTPDKTPKIAESQRAALDQAKALEGALNQQAVQQQQQIDEASK